MNRFASRSEQMEMMDDLTCSGAVVRQTLHELKVINSWLGGTAATLDGVGELVRDVPSGNLTLADLGCGGGDIAYLLARTLERKGHSPNVIGIDANPNIVMLARDQHGDRVRFFAEDIFSEAFRNMKFDVVTATLFFHHFTSTQLSAFIRQLLTQVRIGIVINDIHRHWFSFHSIRILTRLFSRSPMVRHDAPVSVLRAFSRKDLEAILEAAGVGHYAIRWRWAFRWQVVIRV